MSCQNLLNMNNVSKYLHLANATCGGHTSSRNLEPDTHGHFTFYNERDVALSPMFRPLECETVIPFPSILTLTTNINPCQVKVSSLPQFHKFKTTFSKIGTSD